MAWGDLANNQMVSFTDAQGGGFVLQSGQSNVTSSQCMTKSEALAKYVLDSSSMSSYSNNQLVPKSGWFSADDFLPLNQTYRDWTGITYTQSNNVYACVGSGDIYKQTGGTGNFVALNQTSRVWHGMASLPNGDVYACVNGGDIYKQTAGTGSFVALGQTTRDWFAMTATLNGHVYACEFGGDIYKQSYGSGSFVALGQTSRFWTGIAFHPNGDVYACVFTGDIYKQSGGVGNFVALGQTSRDWFGIASHPNGDVYACVKAGANPVTTPGNIYKQTGGTGNFISLSQASRAWVGMTVDLYGGVYGCESNFGLGDIYKKQTTVSDSVTLSHWYYQNYTTTTQTTTGIVTITGNDVTFNARAVVIDSGATCNTSITINGNTVSIYRPLPGTSDSTSFTLPRGTYPYSVTVTSNGGGYAIAGGIVYTQEEIYT